MYKEDILQDRFEQRKLSLRDDYEGKVVSTLIRRLPDNVSGRSLLYIHGFNDYFFQKELAFQLNDHGYSFYALDLRKYGRSYLNHQKFNDIRNIKDYFEEIILALEIIYKEGSKEVYLMGHSTGGLIIALFAKEYTGSGLFSGLLLNSPFFEFNQPYMVKKILPIVACLGKYFPGIKVAGGFSEEYGKYLHESFEGEWDYNLEWKPNVAPMVNLGWVRTMYLAQREIKDSFEIKEPILILHSRYSVTNFSDPSQMKTRDAILDVDSIESIISNIKGNIRIIAVEGGLHDLTLSAKEVRNYVYEVILDWLTRREKDNNER